MSGSFHFSFFIFWSISCHFQAKCGFFIQDSWFFRFWLLWLKSEKQKMEWTGHKKMPYYSRAYWIAWINATSERFWSNCDVFFLLRSYTSPFIDMCLVQLRDSNNLLNIWILTYLFSRIKLKDVRADTSNRDTKYSKTTYFDMYLLLLSRRAFSISKFILSITLQ
jgi:hypothetical protein